MVDRYHGGYSDPSKAKTCKEALAEVRRENAELKQRVDKLKNGLQNAVFVLEDAASHWGEGPPDVYEDVEAAKELLK